MLLDRSSCVIADLFSYYSLNLNKSEGCSFFFFLSNGLIVTQLWSVPWLMFQIKDAFGQYVFIMSERQALVKSDMDVEARTHLNMPMNAEHHRPMSSEAWILSRQHSGS